MTTTLFIPTLNELDAMRVILPQIDRSWVDQILVVDGSTDGTADYAREQGCEVVVQKRKGLRWAFIEGFPHVRGDWVITFSPDGNSPVRAIPLLIEEMKEGYDMVIASRYLPPAKSDDDDLMTAFGNWLFTHIDQPPARPRLEPPLHRRHGDVPHLPHEALLRTGPRQGGKLRPRKMVRHHSRHRAAAVHPRRQEKGEDRGNPGRRTARIGGARKLQPFRWGGAYMGQVWRELVFWK